MTDDMMNLRSLVERSADADLLREMIGDSEPLEQLIERCGQIQARANKADTSGPNNTGE